MIAGITPNGLLAAAFGTRAVGGSSTVRQGEQVNPTQRGEQQSGEAYDQPIDSVEILSRLAGDPKDSSSLGEVSQTQLQDGTGAKGAASASGDSFGQELTAEEQQQVDDLKQRDQEVRRHEQAHAASAGGTARGGPSFEFETGPDGKRYVVSGEVNIDTSPVAGDPKATIAKMEQVRRAALAPGEPSSQDRAVAAQAAAAAQQARAELSQERSQNSPGGNVTEKASSPSVAYSSTGKSEPSVTGQQLDIRI